MDEQRKKRLLRIRLLMMASQLLLAGFVVNWLVSEYRNEKEQLRRDLSREFDATRQVATDSVLFIQLFENEGKGRSTERTRTIKIEHPGKKTNFSRGAMVKIEYVDSSLVRRDSHASGRIKRMNTISFSDANSEIHISDSLPKPILVQGAQVLLSSLGKDKMLLGSLGDELESFLKKDNLNVDSTTVIRTFKQRLERRGLIFNTRFVPNYTNYYQSKSPADIYVENEFFGQKYGIAINGYTTYLLKRISPQALFIMFLLSITTAAFLFTYNTLKKQMQLSVMKNDFISNMSHELKTPISTVKVALEALNNFNMVEDPKVTRDYLEMAALEMNRLDMLVAQALNTTMLEEGRITIRKETQDLGHLVSEVQKALQLRIDQQNATLSVVTNNENITAAVDKLHLQGVIINLIDNSLKYGGNKIEVQLEDTSENTNIAVSDNGPGIPDEYLGKVFEKFFRVPSGDRHDVKGYGLGLSYAKQVIQQHGGTITAANNPGNGCTFTITIPKA
jgi:signal transduction histidine kinase